MNEHFTASNISLDSSNQSDSAFTTLKRFLLQQDHQHLLLCGQPGTGRHRLTNRLLKDIASDSWTIQQFDLTDAQQLPYLIDFSTKQLKEITGNPSSNKLLIIDGLEYLRNDASTFSSIISCLKMMLTVSQLRCILIIDDAFYRQHIYNEKFFLRHCQLLQLLTPTAEEALNILLAQQEEFEQQYHVTIEPPALKLATEIAERYISNWQLPKSAMLLLHQAAAETQRQNESTVNTEVIATVAAISIALSPEFIVEPFAEKLLHLTERLTSQIIDQANSCELLVQYLRNHFLKLTDSSVAHFIVAGPFHVGKSTLATALSQELFGNNKFFLKIDLTEYQFTNFEKLLIKLIDFRKKFTCGIWLFDNIQSASFNLLFTLRQIVENGEIVDNNNHSYRLNHIIIIFNAHIPDSDLPAIYEQPSENLSPIVPHESPSGLLQLVLTDFPTSKPSVNVSNLSSLINPLKDYLTPIFGKSFIEKINIIPFLPLTENCVPALISKHIANLSKITGIEISLEDDLLNEIKNKIYEQKINGLTIKNIIQQEVWPSLTSRLLGINMNEDQQTKLKLSKNVNSISISRT